MLECPQNAVEVYKQASKIIIEVFPVTITPEIDARTALIRQNVALGKLLSLPEHWNALACIQCNRKGLQFIPGTSVHEKNTRRWLAMAFTIGYTKQTARLPLQATN